MSKLEDIVEASKGHEELLTAGEIDLKKIQDKIDEIRKKKGDERYKEMLGFLEATQTYRGALEANLQKRVYVGTIKEGLDDKEKVLKDIVKEFEDQGVVPGGKVMKGDPMNKVASLIGLALNGADWYKRAMDDYKDEGEDQALKDALAIFATNYAAHHGDGKADNLVAKIAALVKEGKITRDSAHGGENAWDLILETISGGYASRHIDQILGRLIGKDQDDHYRFKEHIEGSGEVKAFLKKRDKELDTSALYGENIGKLASLYASGGGKAIADLYKKKSKEEVDFPT